MKTHTTLLKRIQKDFPTVTKVIDARKSIVVEVNSKDVKTSKKKDVNNCAMAQACKRQGLADGAIIGIGYSYLIRKNKAIRFKTSQGVAREIVSFDRHQDFATGKDYLLSKVSQLNRLTNKNSKPSGKKKNYTPIVHKHRTTNIRILKSLN